MSNRLKHELRAAGASASEIDQLFAIATKLPELKTYKHSAGGTVLVERRRLWVVKLAIADGLSLALGLFIILAAQTALPTAWLYPVQRATDSIAVAVHPRYRATVMMKRAQQVDALVTAHADTEVVLATLTDYTDQAKAYETLPNANYAALEFCKTSLQHAAVNAPPAIRQAIQNSLSTVETT